MLERRPPAQLSSRRVRKSRRAVDAARLVLAPSGLVAAGAGVGIGEWAALPLAATISLAVFGWLARLTVASSIRWWRRLPLVTIDPYAVNEPWREMVREALGAQRRFDEIANTWPNGPLHDRLAEAEQVVHDAVGEVWRVARLGSAMAWPDTGVADDLGRRLRAIQQRPAQRSIGTAVFDEEAAIAEQLQAVRRRQQTTVIIESHVRRVVTQLNAAVTDVASLALGVEAPHNGLSVMDQLSSELHSLHQALGELTP